MVIMPIVYPVNADLRCVDVGHGKRTFLGFLYWVYACQIDLNHELLDCTHRDWPQLAKLEPVSGASVNRLWLLHAHASSHNMPAGQMG